LGVELGMGLRKNDSGHDEKPERTI
jgi:hypothetical protein